MTATTEPSSLRAGDTWRWDRSLADYPAGTWTLTYYLRSASAAYSFAATAAGTTHAVTVAAATTAAYKPGTYSWIARATDGTTVTTVGEGELEVLPNLGATGAYDARSHARKMLDAIEALLEGRAGSDVSSYAIGGRSISKMSMAELIAARSQYEAMVKKEERAAKLASGTGLPRIQVRF